MANFYFKNSPPKVNQEIPEMVKFLLDYSKALRVVDCQGLQFELILN